MKDISDLHPKVQQVVSWNVSVNSIFHFIQFYAQQLSHNMQRVLTNREFAKLSLVTNKLDPPQEKEKWISKVQI